MKGWIIFDNFSEKEKNKNLTITIQPFNGLQLTVTAFTFSTVIHPFITSFSSQPHLLFKYNPQKENEIIKSGIILEQVKGGVVKTKRGGRLNY